MFTRARAAMGQPQSLWRSHETRTEFNRPGLCLRMNGPSLPAPLRHRGPLHLVVGATAIVAPSLHSLSDLMEWHHRGFTAIQLWITYAAFLPMPWLLFGIFAVHQPRLGTLCLAGAILYGAAFSYFTHTALYALSEQLPTYEALWARLGRIYSFHGALMVLGGVLFAGPVFRAGWLPRPATVLFLAGLLVNLILAVLPAPDIFQTAGSLVRNLGLMAMGYAIVIQDPERAAGSTEGHRSGRSNAMSYRHLLGWSVLLALAAGCAHHPMNAPLVRDEPGSGYRFNNLGHSNNSDDLLIILAFSGGGTRAAALSYGVLEELARTEIVWEGERRRLLNEVDIISAVSGGSFTAAYYGLFGDRIFTDFEEKFLKRNVQGHLVRRYFSPWNWFRLASGSFDRSDLAAEYYDRHIFERQTFGDLRQRGQRPSVIINATDMSTGARFEFVQEQFDLLCSDITSFPVSRAVAASAAYPVLLSPITLANYAGQRAYAEPDWMAQVDTGGHSSSRRHARVAELRSYRDASRRPFIHLLDGGLADNLGLRAVLEAVYSMEDAWSAMQAFKLEKMRQVVVIVVNAEAGRDRGWDRKKTAPSWIEVITAAGAAGVSRYSFETMELLRVSIEKWGREIQARRIAEHRARTKGAPAEFPAPPELRFYPIEVGFDALADPAERHYYKNIPTTLNLPPATVDQLRELSGRVLRESASYQELLRDLKSAAPP